MCLQQCDYVHVAHSACRQHCQLHHAREQKVLPINRAWHVLEERGLSAQFPSQASIITGGVPLMFWCLVITHGASDLGLNSGDSIAHDWGWYHIYTSADHVLVALCNLKVLAYYNCCRKETRLHILKAFLMTILSLTVLLEAHRILCMTQTSIKGLRFVPIPL